MRAAVLDAFGADVRIAEVDEPKADAGEVRIDVAACGVGLTLERARTGALGGTAPRIVGHEFAGTVAETGAGVERWQIGDRVTASFYLTCGSCRWCAGGRETLCENFGGFIGIHVDGGLADSVVLPERNLVRIPDGVGFAEAAIAADAIATPYHAFAARAPISPGQTVAVIGAGGGVGVHVVGMARAFGANVIGIERDAEKERALCDHGCRTVWNPGDEAEWSTKFLREVGGKVDTCVDTVASRDTLSNGIDIVGRAGTLLVVGFQGAVTFELDPRSLVLDEVLITGSRYADRAEIGRALELVAQQRVAAVIGARFGLDDVAEAYRVMQDNAAFGRIVVDVR